MPDVTIALTQAEANLLNRCVRAGQSARSAGHLVCGITTYSEPDQEIQRELNALDRITREAHFHAINPDEPIPDGSRVRVVVEPQDDPQPDEQGTCATCGNPVRLAYIDGVRRSFHDGDTGLPGDGCPQDDPRPVMPPPGAGQADDVAAFYGTEGRS